MFENNPAKTAAGCASKNKFIRVFFAVFLLAVISSVLITYILPETFAGKARVKAGMVTRETAGTVESECQIVRSEIVLGKVVDQLQLNAVWGKKYAGGQPLKQAESLEFLRKSLDVRPIKKTAIVEIIAFSEHPDEAAQIANAVADVYTLFRQNRPLDIDLNTSNLVEKLADSATVVIDHATPNSEPARPNKPMIIALGVVVGAVLGAAIAALATGLGSPLRNGQGRKS